MRTAASPSAASILLIGVYRPRNGARKAGSRIVWYVNTTSAAVSGVPSWKRTLRRRRNTHTVGDTSVHVQSDAQHGSGGGRAHGGQRADNDEEPGAEGQEPAQRHRCGAPFS